jgi:hypothetical protein
VIVAAGFGALRETIWSQAIATPVQRLPHAFRTGHLAEDPRVVRNEPRGYGEGPPIRPETHGSAYRDRRRTLRDLSPAAPSFSQDEADFAINRRVAQLQKLYPGRQFPRLSITLRDRAEW